MHIAGIDPQDGEIAALLVGQRLEGEGHRLLAGQADPARLVRRVHGLGGRAVDGRGAEPPDEIEQPRHPDIGFARSAEQRDEHLLLHGGMNAGAHDLLGQAAFVEIFLQQGVVGLRDVLDELLVQRLDPGFPLARGGQFLVLARAVRRVGADLVAQHVEHLVEARARVHRHLHRENLGAKPLPDLLEEEVVIDVLLVQRVDHDDFRDTELGGVIPHHLGADPDAMNGMDHHHGKIHDPERVERLAAEIEVPRGVEGVQPAILPFEAERRGMNRNLPLLLAHMVVGHRRTLDDAAHAVDDSAAHEHGFRQHGLARGRVADDREVTDVRRLIGFHRRII